MWRYQAGTVFGMRRTLGILRQALNRGYRTRLSTQRTRRRNTRISTVPGKASEKVDVREHAVHGLVPSRYTLGPSHARARRMGKSTKLFLVPAYCECLRRGLPFVQSACVRSRGFCGCCVAGVSDLCHYEFVFLSPGPEKTGYGSVHCGDTVAHNLRTGLCHIRRCCVRVPTFETTASTDARRLKSAHEFRSRSAVSHFDCCRSAAGIWCAGAGLQCAKSRLSCPATDYR